MASGTTKKTELKLFGIALGSQEELLLDFQDFFRQQRRFLCCQDHPPEKAVRSLCRRKNKSQGDCRIYFDESYSEIVTDKTAWLIYQYSFFFDKQLSALEKKFL